MTAVARLIINGYPVIVGDLLVSSYGEYNSSVSFPTIKDLLQPPPSVSGYAPSGFSQKVSIIADNVVIGWAGDRLAAKTIITELFEKSKEKALNLDTIKLYFDNLDKAISDRGIQFAGFVKDSRGIGHFNFNCKTAITKSYGCVASLGTGGDSLIELIKQLPEKPIPLSGNLNDLEMAIATALSLCGTFLQLEFTSVSPISLLFGGGYEIATYVRDKFQKIDDISYSFWSAKVKDNEVSITLPHLSLKYSYSKDLLVIRRALFKNKEGVRFKQVKESLHVVTPMYRYPSRPELSKISIPLMDSMWSCNYFFVNDALGEVEVYSDIHKGVNKEGLIKFIEKETGGGLLINKKLIENIASSFRWLC